MATKKSIHASAAKKMSQTQKNGSALASKTHSAAGKAAGKAGQESHSDAEVLLKADHRKVEKLFKQYESTQSPEDKKKLSEQICSELIIHTQLEEELLYPACRDGGVEDGMLDEAQVEHDGAKVLIAQLIALPVESANYDAKLKVLSEYIKHHVTEEEKPGDGIFAKARHAGVDMAALGNHIQSRKKELLSEQESNVLSLFAARSFELSDFINRFLKENQIMSNYQNRDNQGRYTSNDDYGSRGRYNSREQYDSRDNDGRYSGRSGSQSRNQNRDEYGRYASDEDHNRGEYDDRGQGGYDDDYNDRGSSSRQERGQSDRQGSGWYGDSEGHSQAARRNNYGDDNDDRGNYRSAGNRGSQSSSRSERGSYQEDRDSSHSAGQRGARNQGHGGWFGDSEGHAAAARQGHGSSGRGGYEDDRDDYRSSGRGSQNNRGRGHGGWSGDPEGHAEAARRGWENR